VLVQQLLEVSNHTIHLLLLGLRLLQQDCLLHGVLIENLYQQAMEKYYQHEQQQVQQLQL